MEDILPAADLICSPNIFPKSAEPSLSTLGPARAEPTDAIEEFLQRLLHTTVGLLYSYTTVHPV